MACLFFIVGCEKDQTKVSESIITEKSIGVKAANILLCHNGSLKSVPISALSGHLSHGDVQLIDNDGDGFVTQANACGLPVDFDDTNDGILPDAIEICDDGIDNNCNGLVDCKDEMCTTPTSCSSCEVITQSLLDMIVPTNIPSESPPQRLEITENSSSTNYMLYVNTYGFHAPLKRNFVFQMGIFVSQSTSNEPIYSYTLNGDFLNQAGNLVSYIPGKNGFVDDGNYMVCYESLIAYAQQYGITIEYN